MSIGVQNGFERRFPKTPRGGATSGRPTGRKEDHVLLCIITRLPFARKRTTLLTRDRPTQ